MHKRFVLLKPLILVLFMAHLVGCVTNPITGRSQAMTVSDADAARTSASAYQELLVQAQNQKRLDEDPTELQRVNHIAHAIIQRAIQLRPQTSYWNWDVHVLKSDEINAWCMAGGKIAVYTGLLNTIQPSDDELAVVLGHEIAHALLSHQAEKMSRAQMQNAGISIGLITASALGFGVPGMGTLASSAAQLGLELPNSREAETEADQVGLRLSAEAGFNPEAAVSLWEKMAQYSNSKTPGWLSTHPDPGSRINAMRLEAEQLKPVYEAAKASKTP